MTRAFDRARSHKTKHAAGRSRAKLLATLTVQASFALALTQCTSVDAGPNIVVGDQTFDADYFYCHVEPEVIIAKNCGAGGGGGCHFNSSAVTGMDLIDHPAVDCGGGDHPVDSTQVGSGSAAQGNYAAVSLEMNADYTLAALYVRPTGTSHNVIFTADDPAVAIIRTWSLK